jgi:hypothetical protein
MDVPEIAPDDNIVARSHFVAQHGMDEKGGRLAGLRQDVKLFDTSRLF